MSHLSQSWSKLKSWSIWCWRPWQHFEKGRKFRNTKSIQDFIMNSRVFPCPTRRYIIQKHILRRRFGRWNRRSRDILWRGFYCRIIIHPHVILRFSWGWRRFLWWESHSLASVKALILKWILMLCVDVTLVANYGKRWDGFVLFRSPADRINICM